MYTANANPATWISIGNESIQYEKQTRYCCRHFITSYSRQKSGDFITTLLLFKISTSLALLHPHHNIPHETTVTLSKWWSCTFVYIDIAFIRYQTIPQHHTSTHKYTFDVFLIYKFDDDMSGWTVNIFRCLSVALLLPFEQFRSVQNLCVEYVCVRVCVASHPIACHNIGTGGIPLPLTSQTHCIWLFNFKYRSYTLVIS